MNFNNWWNFSANTVSLKMTLSIRRADFETDFDALRQIRETVFVQEQSVPLALEWDEHDKHALHLLAEQNGYPIATARMLADGRIGRMAVLSEWRRQGVGTALLRRLIDEAQQQGLEQVYLAAQVSAIPFYERMGFTVTSEVYDDAGIPHRDMQLRLAS
jgi:predicted GNAT family N-acyltransferase